MIKKIAAIFLILAYTVKPASETEIAVNQESAPNILVFVADDAAGEILAPMVTIR